MTTSLLEKQQTFTRLTASLIEFAYSHGYSMTYGEAYRTSEQAKLNAIHGKGIAHSLHTDRLAVDFNLFKDGVWLQKSEDFKLLGEYWESLSTPGFECCWGGRFGDGNHFSVADGGRK